MIKPDLPENLVKDHLAIHANAPIKYESWLFHMYDAIIQTDLGFHVTGWNIAAEKLYGQSGAMGKFLFDLIDIEFSNSSIRELQKELAISSCWGDEVVYSRYDGQKILLQITATYVYNNEGQTRGVIFVAHNIAEAKRKEIRLVEAELALQKSIERFSYAAKVTSDAIWDIDLETNQIYRSDAFITFSGYNTSQIEPNLDWWFNNIHPEDKDRVKNNFNNCLRAGLEDWQDEYRFQCANGTFKYLIDRGAIIYNDGKPARIIGAIEDITERKNLQRQLLNEEIKEHKEINLAIIAAQEKERNNISEELHDNVNQILMSARLFMTTAQKKPEQAAMYLQKAIDYQAMALDEIRRLSRSLNSSMISTIGLKESIEEVLLNLRTLKNLKTKLVFDPALNKKLSKDQALILFRIIQEQTSNILKYAKAKNVNIVLKIQDSSFSLSITDDGVGFDTTEKREGIGLTNIINRTKAFNGALHIHTKPGAGCQLEVIFPL